MAPPSLPIVLVLLSLLLSLASAVVVATRARVSAGPLVQLVVRLVKAGDGERILRLAQAVPGLPLLVGLESLARRATGPLPIDEDAGADYRRDPGGQAEALRRHLREDFERALRGPLRVIGVSWALSGASAVAMGAALGVGLVAVRPWWAMTAAVGGVQLWAWWARRSLRAGVTQLLDGLLEPMTQAWLRRSLRAERAADGPIPDGDVNATERPAQAAGGVRVSREPARVRAESEAGAEQDDEEDGDRGAVQPSSSSG